jgi:aldehyde dehydrogenase (NAD+)
MDVLQSLGISSINSGASIGSQWWSSPQQKILESRNPATDDLIAKIALCNTKDLEKVIAASYQAFLSWRKVPAAKRGNLVRLIADELRLHKDALGTLVAMECGKIKQEGDGEVQEMIDMADFAVGLSRTLYGNTMHSERSQHRLYEQWHPLGIVGVISAFNFPVAVWSWNAFIAAVCGDTVIWKPSRKVALCAIAVQQICNRVMERAGYQGIFSLIIPETNEISEKFIADQRLSLISFTGSTIVGSKVNQTVAARLGRTILEMSGNNAVIVDETANFALAIPAIVFGAIGTAGQRCTSIRRLIVHESRYAELMRKLIAAYKKIKIGNPLEPDVLMGPLIDQEAVKMFTATLATVKKMGGKVLYGGKIISGPGNFVEPTIVRAENHWPIVQQETFAPILYVMTYQHLSEAVAMQNNVPQGLSSAIFTENLLHAEYFLSNEGSDCGIANVNISTSGAEITGAFGGEKQTGGGREAGSDAWKAYMRRQTNTINWGKKMPLAQGIKFEV